MIEPTKPSMASPSACSETGSWLIPYVLEDRDRVADPLRGPGDDEVGRSAAWWRSSEQVADAGRPPRSWRAGRSTRIHSSL